MSAASAFAPTGWRPGTIAPARPGSTEIHLWRAGIHVSSLLFERLWRHLAPDERARADAFRFQRDRARFVGARGFLRAVLGSYLDVEPGDLRFDYGPYGKPRLSGRSAGGGLAFNLSHSGGLVLLAVTHGREIGVDLERIRPFPEHDRLAARFFSRREHAAIRALPQDEREAGFFSCWTRKEAFVKAHGSGLSLPLDRFSVAIAPGGPAALLSTDWDPAETSHWALQAVDPGPGYVGALAVEGAVGSIETFAQTSPAR